MPIDSLMKFARNGINTDIAPATLSGDHFTHAQNVRVYDGAFHPSGGWDLINDIPLGMDIKRVAYVSSRFGGYLILLSLDKIYHYDGAFTEVQPDTMPAVSSPDSWSICKLGEIPIVSSPETGPMYFSYPDFKYKSLPWKPGQDWNDAKKTTNIMRSHKQFLFALRIQENGVDMGDGVRWSSVADIGSIPPTWDELDVTNVAGITSLGGSGGAIIDGLALRDSFVVYRELGITVFDYVGGTYVWRIRHLTSSVGLLSADCIVEANGIHYFIGNGDVYKNDGTTVKSIMHNRIRKQFSISINPDAYQNSVVVHNAAKAEVWFCVPSKKATYPNIAFIYNYSDDTWAMRDLPGVLDVVYGREPERGPAWNSIPFTWDELARPWNEPVGYVYDNILLSVIPEQDGEAGKIINVSPDIGFTSEPFSSILERTSYPLGGVESTTTINRVFPYMTGTADVYLQFGSQANAGGPVTWKPAIKFNPNKERKIDLRTTGQLHSFRIYSDSVKKDFAFIGMDIEYVKAGSR